jgi:hypothetical protein
VSAPPQVQQKSVRPFSPRIKSELGIDFRAPNKTGLYAFSDGSHVIENFNDEPIEVQSKTPHQLTATLSFLPKRLW